jgi:hypothetical protein
MDTSTIEMKRVLLRQPVIVVIEQAWVDFTPDGKVTPLYRPVHPCVEARLDFDCCQFKPQFTLHTLCPAIVAFNGSVYKVEGAAEFYRGNVLGGWTDVIVDYGG